MMNDEMTPKRDMNLVKDQADLVPDPHEFDQVLINPLPSFNKNTPMHRRPVELPFRPDPVSSLVK